MFTFRQRIFFGYTIVFLVFLAALYPLASLIVQKIVRNTLENRSRELIQKIEEAPNNEALVRMLKDQKPLMFFRVSVITQDRKVLYDSHTKRLLGPKFSQEYVVDHPEVIEAFQKGIGYSEGYSQLLGQKFAYMAIPFNFHGKEYILRTSFPFRFINELKSDFELGFLAMASIILILFSLLSWIVITRLMKPIQRIIDAVSPYQERKTNILPQIELKGLNPKDEFLQLANTLNSMTKLIQEQLDSLKKGANEKQVLLESLLEGVIAVDSQSNLTFANDSAYKLLNLTPNDPLPPSCLELLKKCQKEEKVLQDVYEAKPIYLNLIAAPKKDKTGALLVLQDQTKEIKILEMRKDFIANASHELKTPLTIIRGFAETLHDNHNLNPEIYNGITEKIVRNCDRMNLLIKDLLALADIENLPSFRFQTFDLNKIISKSIEMVQTVYTDAIITLHAPDSVTLKADPDLIEMAINNLLTNAAKYSTPPAKIDIYIKSDDQFCTLKVQDHGIGIPPQDLDRIFERFYRVDKTRSRRMGGSGLGLAIVQTIVQKHNGTLAVDSEVNKGTTFTIKIPVQPIE